MHYGERFRELRKGRGLSGRTFAERAEFDKNTVTKIEQSADFAGLSFGTVQKALESVGETPEEFFAHLYLGVVDERRRELRDNIARRLKDLSPDELMALSRHMDATYPKSVPKKEPEPGRRVTVAKKPGGSGAGGSGRGL